MRARYLIREAFINLKRNALIVMGAILAAFLTLLLAFSAVVVTHVVRANTLRWEGGIRVIGFLQDELSIDAVTALTGEVAGWDGVDEIVYFTKAEALEEALIMFKDEPLLVDIILEDPTALPASLRIKPVDTDVYDPIADRLTATPGIREVQRSTAAIEQFRAIKTGLTYGSIGAAVFLGVAAVALIANTIRMAIYARRDEIGIMKLVGAGNWFVRIPFLLEGMIEGLIGGALAVGIMFGVQHLSEGWATSLPDFIDLEIPFDFVVRWGIVVLLGGVLVGMVGSGIALRRFLRE